MSDLLLLGLIGALTLLLLLTLLAFAGHSGLLAEVAVSAGSPPLRNITVAYKFHRGQSGRLFTESCSISPRLRSIAVYYDNPHTVPPEKCRSAVGSILGEGEEPPSPELIHLYQKFGFKVVSFPAPSHAVTASFPYTTPLSIWLAARRVHPALDAYIKERRLCAHPWLEVYQQDQIHFMCPLARQGDFYVPEVKETERKSRGPAEPGGALVDGTGAHTSDRSSVSLEVATGSRETSAATLSPGAGSRGLDEDGDTRSELSYSESGASGSSFEELDLEGEGPLGEPRGGPEAEPLGADKWPRELSAPEKGEE